jgi:exonuclease I
MHSVCDRCQVTYNIRTVEICTPLILVCCSFWHANAKHSVCVQLAISPTNTKNFVLVGNNKFHVLELQARVVCSRLHNHKVWVVEDKKKVSLTTTK